MNLLKLERFFSRIEKFLENETKFQKNNNITRRNILEIECPAPNDNSAECVNDDCNWY